MNPMLLQKQLRDNANDLQDFCKELKQWGDEMKRKEEVLKSDDSNVISGKSKIKKKQPQDSSKSIKKTKLRSYQDWEKFDVEAECKKIDREEDSESVESDLTDEFDESVRDAALLEKEKGNKFVKKQQWDVAINHYTNAIDLYAYDPIFYANRALCYLKKENYKQAEVDCTTALQLDKTYVKAFQRRAAAREALGQLSEAHSDLLKVFDYEPNNKESKLALAKLEKKLENIKKPPTSKDLQKPVSKFTLSRQQKKQTKPVAESKSTDEKTIEFDINKIEVVERKAKEAKIEVIEQKTKTEDKIETSTNRIIDKNKSTHWPSGDDVILIKSIMKQPHQRSKRPLKRVNIHDSDTNVSTIKNEFIQNKNVSKESYNKTENTSNKAELTLSVPRTSVQFYSTWKMIKDDPVSRFRYLSQIEPKEYRNIFFESLSTDLFSDILETLAESFVKENKPVYEHLEGLTHVKRFTTLALFMSANDKNAVLKLTDFMKASGCTNNEIDNIKQKYGLC